MKYEQNLKTVTAYLPFALRNALSNVKNLPEKIIEIRLIREKPIILTTMSKRYFITEDYKLCGTFGDNLIITGSCDIDEAFSSMCEYSVYSKQGEISNGFITLSGGNRAGICGTAVNRNNSVYNIRNISSINIRVADEIIDCSKILLKKINLNKGVLICGAPCSGKTTILRDMSRLLSYKYKVSLIDTRLELAGCNKGVAQFDVGLCDVFSAYNKHDGFEHSLRCMSPEIIICDEIGESDIVSVENAQKSGVCVIASAHCRDKPELLRKPSFNKLIKSKCFSSIVFLKSGKNLGQVSEIISGDKLW